MPKAELRSSDRIIEAAKRLKQAVDKADEHGGEHQAMVAKRLNALMLEIEDYENEGGG